MEPVSAAFKLKRLGKYTSDDKNQAGAANTDLL